MTAGQVIAILGGLAAVVVCLKLHDLWLRSKKRKKHKAVKPLSDSELLK